MSKSKKQVLPTVDEIVDAATKDKLIARRYSICRYSDDISRCAFHKKDNVVMIDTSEYDDRVELMRYDQYDVTVGFVCAKTLDEILAALRYFANHKKLPNEDVP